MMYRRLLLLLPVLTLHCTHAPIAPPLPATVQTVAVLPPNNRTGDTLLVESASFWDPEAARPGRVTVADVLAADARAQLERRGVKVIAPEALTAAIGTQTAGSPREAAGRGARGKAGAEGRLPEI